MGEEIGKDIIFQMFALTHHIITLVCANVIRIITKL